MKPEELKIHRELEYLRAVGAAYSRKANRTPKNRRKTLAWVAERRAKHEAAQERHRRRRDA